MSKSIGLSGLLRTHTCGELRVDDSGKEITLCGWANKVRDLGGLHFVDLRDKFGITQLSFDAFKGDVKEALKKVSLETVILVKGKVQKRPSTAINKEMPTGEVELSVTHIEVLSQAQTLPFLPTAKNDATEVLRMKYRYLDLRSQKLQDMIALRSDIMNRVRASLREENFVEVETPVLYKSTPEGARDYLVPSRVHPGKVYALPQSPQTLKQLLMIGGTDKYFQIVKCFRDEDLRSDRQPEFTQIDIEVSFATPVYIKNLVEKLLKNVFSLPADFHLPTMTYQEAMDLYGSDKPDVRFGLPHVNFTDFFRDYHDFPLFHQLACEGGLIKGIYIPSTLKQFSRKEVDDLALMLKPLGIGGMPWVKVIPGQDCAGSIGKFIKGTALVELRALTPGEPEGTWFFIGHQNAELAHQGADQIRRFLGKSLNLLGNNYSFLWVVDFPLLEYDAGAGRFMAKHHPFTSPHTEDLELFRSSDKEDLEKCRAFAYDIVCNGYELGGGSVRIHNGEVQERMFEVLGMGTEEVEKQFGFFIEALRYGTPPHAGIAFGLDRMMMLLSGSQNLSDVIAFPKTTSATDLMSGSPSAPASHQLRDLHFKWSIEDKKEV